MAGIYIHIPYCARACHYCNFHFSTSTKNIDALVDTLCIEIQLKKNLISQDSTITTIYFGGGTPSLLNEKQLERIVLQIHKQFKIHNDFEFTFECNPDDINKDKLQELKKFGVNRLSIGIQSFDYSDLEILNRSHNAKQALESIELAAITGFSNLNIDLMFGLPYQDKKKWVQNLKIANSLPIQHISCYNLTVEEKTAMKKLIEDKKLPQQNENESAELFEYLMEWAESNNWEQYEISNFAKNGVYSKHNSSYWKSKAYIGIGPSAHSFDGINIRQNNIANNSQYIKKVNAGEAYFEIEILSEINRYNEFILTRLRTKWGIDLKELRNLFSRDYQNHFLLELKPFVENGDVLNMNEVYTLTKSGKYIADYISSSLFITNHY